MSDFVTFVSTTTHIAFTIIACQEYCRHRICGPTLHVLSLLLFPPNAKTLTLEHMNQLLAEKVAFFFYQGRATAGRCPLGWTKTCSGTCIKYFSTEENLPSAEFYCANRTGGRLVTLETKEKITFFKGFLVEEGKF